MVDAATAEVVSVMVLTSGKEFTAPSASVDFKAHAFAMLWSAWWFDIDDLVVEGFIDQYATGGWLPGDVPLE